MKVLRHQPRTDLATVGFTGHERSSSLADERAVSGLPVPPARPSRRD